MQKHGLLGKLPFYRMSTENQIPWLGYMGYTPILLYVRKEGDEITEIKLLESPFNYQSWVDKFINQLEEKSEIPDLSKIIKIDHIAQIVNNFNRLDQHDEYDFDFDAVEGYVTSEQKQKLKEEAEKEQPEAKN